MQPGSIDLIIFGLIFIGLQTWWIIPIVRQNNSFDEKSSNLKKNISARKALQKIKMIVTLKLIVINLHLLDDIPQLNNERKNRTKVDRLIHRG